MSNRLVAIDNHGIGWELPRMYRWPQCRFCGMASDRDCPGVICLACGSRICHGYGLGNGCCPVCYHGIFPTWSGWDRECGYKRCHERAVAKVPRMGTACARPQYVTRHLDVGGVAGWRWTRPHTSRARRSRWRRCVTLCKRSARL